MYDIEIQEVRLLIIKLVDIYCYVGADIAMLWVVLWQLSVLNGNISVAARERMGQDLGSCSIWIMARVL